MREACYKGKTIQLLHLFCCLILWEGAMEEKDFIAMIPDEEVIKENFKKALSKNCHFYIGGRELKIAEFKVKNILSLTKGEYKDGFNYKVRVLIAYKEIDYLGNLYSEGEEGKTFETTIKVKGEEIKAIDRISVVI